MLVKSLDHTNHVKHFEEAFVFLRKFNVKLNHEKCTFGVASNKFFGYQSLSGELKQNSDQISAVLERKSPTTVKEV